MRQAASGLLFVGGFMFPDKIFFQALTFILIKVPSRINYVLGSRISFSWAGRTGFFRGREVE